eukprot:UN28799
MKYWKDIPQISASHHLKGFNEMNESEQKAIDRAYKKVLSGDDENPSDKEKKKIFIYMFDDSNIAVRGNTYPIKDILKEHKGYWSYQNTLWMFNILEMDNVKRLFDLKNPISKTEQEPGPNFLLVDKVKKEKDHAYSIYKNAENDIIFKGKTFDIKNKLK